MSKAGSRLLANVRSARAALRGEAEGHFEVHAPAPDVRAIRKHLGLSQAQFAERFGFDLATLRNWEQGRRQPEGPARAYLKVIEREPELVQRALVA
jgi:putative transcriptional regulator